MRCSCLVDELEIANAQFNLTAIRDRPGMLRKHVLDSLSVQPFLKGTRVADVGTGAGFPGLPLAIVNPERRFSLIEATGKKARFVERTVAAAGSRATSRSSMSAPSDFGRSSLSIPSSRGRCPRSSDFVAYAGHLCAPDGRLLAMKGKRPDEEIWALPKSFRVVAVHRIKLPGLDDERHIVELSPAGRGSAIRPKASTR